MKTLLIPIAIAGAALSGCEEYQPTQEEISQESRLLAAKDTLDLQEKLAEMKRRLEHELAERREKLYAADPALKKLTDEVEHRPLVMLAVAAGIGFLAGLANRR